MSFRFPFIVVWLGGFSALPLFAQEAKKEPVVPAFYSFKRSIDVESLVGATNRQGLGMQSGRLRFRYLDPDVNAFAGLQASVHHFNQDLRTGDPQNPSTAGVMANWGGHFGVVRGRHVWEIDLLGSNLSNHLGYAMALVGEHRLYKGLWLYHRTEANVFSNDFVFDANQGLYWMFTPSFGLTTGYRWFTSFHMDRSGPCVGLRLYFESPKIPFLFPSIG